MGIIVVSPCYVLPSVGRTRKGAGQLPCQVSYDRSKGAEMRLLLFIVSRGAQPSPNISTLCADFRQPNEIRIAPAKLFMAGGIGMYNRRE